MLQTENTHRYNRTTRLETFEYNASPPSGFWSLVSWDCKLRLIIFPLWSLDSGEGSRSPGSTIGQPCDVQTLLQAYRLKLHSLLPLSDRC